MKYCKNKNNNNKRSRETGSKTGNAETRAHKVTGREMGSTWTWTHWQ